MTCGKLLWHKLINHGMLTLGERKQGKEMKQVADVAGTRREHERRPEIQSYSSEDD